MRNLDKLTGSQILSVEEPEKLFSQSSIDRKAEYRQLVLLWHPDQAGTPESEPVFRHIVRLYKDAMEKATKCLWNEPVTKIEDDKPNVVVFKPLDYKGADSRLKSRIELKYLSKGEFELGTYYVGSQCITYVVKEEFSDLYDNALRRIKNFKYLDAAMEKEMSRFLPKIEANFSISGAKVLVIAKRKDQLLLSDVLKHLGGQIKPIAHTAWILNLLYNINCYLQYASLVNNDINSESILISPTKHDGILLSWWYADSHDRKLTALPGKTVSVIPSDALREKRCAYRTDLELIRALGRELLGDRTGNKLRTDSTLPKRMVKFLTDASSGKAVNDYKVWKRNVVPDCFGPPKFVILDTNESDLYSNKGAK